MNVDRSSLAQAYRGAATAAPVDQYRDPLLTALDIDLQVLTSLTLVVGRVAARLDPAEFQDALREERQNLAGSVDGEGLEGRRLLLVGLLDEMIGACFEGNG